MLGLIGPDGVGKSTLLGLLAGARKIQAGEVTVLGGSMANRDHREAAFHRIAYMPQGLGKNLYMELSVRENLDFFGRLFGHDAAERRRRIDRLSKATGLDPFLDRPAGKLSGGMKQKLGLCCALIHDPDFLILDEPTTGVDPLSRRPVLGPDRRYPRRPSGDERAGLHRLHGGGGALRLAGRDGCGTGAGDRQPGGAARPDRQGRSGGGLRLAPARRQAARGRAAGDPAARDAGRRPCHRRRRG